MTRRELSGDEWELIEPFLPIGRYGPFPQHLREQFEGVIWRFRTGSQWQEMPKEFGTWQTVYDRFAQRRDIGVFAALMEGLTTPRPRGGLTSKVHFAADRRCRPLAFVLTPGQAADSPRLIAVLEKVRVRTGRPPAHPTGRGSCR